MSDYNLLSSSWDLYQKLLFDYKEFEKKPSSRYKALDCASGGWHLIDWVLLEYEMGNYPNLSAKAALGELRKKFEKECPSLSVMHDITNGAKHLTLTHTRSDMAGYYTDGYAQEGYVSTGYVKDNLMIDFMHDESLSFLEIIEDVIKFWDNYFHSKSIRQ